MPHSPLVAPRKLRNERRFFVTPRLPPPLFSLFLCNIPHIVQPHHRSGGAFIPLSFLFAMKILITGAAGFVGCRATRFLGLSHQVIPLNSKQLDVTDEEMIHTLFMDHAPHSMWRGQPRLSVRNSSMPVAIRSTMAVQRQDSSVRMCLLRPKVSMLRSNIVQNARSKNYCPQRWDFVSRGCMMCPTPPCDKTTVCCFVCSKRLEAVYLSQLPSTNVAASRMFGKSCAASKPPSPCRVEFTTSVRPTVAPLTTPCSKPRAFWPPPGIWKPGVPRPPVLSKRRNATWP